MKKIILSVMVLTTALFTSCVKERNCKCTTTDTYAGSSKSYTETTVYKDVTKKQAKILCASSTTTDESGLVTTKDCKLE